MTGPYLTIFCVGIFVCYISILFLQMINKALIAALKSISILQEKIILIETIMTYKNNENET